jgi:hypothetical protein
VSGWLDLAGYAAAWEARGGTDPYLRPEYLHAAAAIEVGEPAAYVADGVLYPFLVRDLGEGRCDLTSAYGAGGPYGTGHGWRQGFVDEARAHGVVSEFVRFHPILENQIVAAGMEVGELEPNITVQVQATDDELVAQMEPTARNKLRKAMRAGVEVREHRDLDRFASLYLETMRGMGADPFYLFPAEFFARLERLGDALVVLDADTAAGIFLSGGGAMHYFLAGSTLEARKLASANLVLFEAMRRARDAGLETLVLGSGLTEGDSLNRFKRSIGAGRAPKTIGKAVHDAAAYAELTTAAGVPADTRFFPAYRGSSGD